MPNAYPIDPLLPALAAALRQGSAAVLEAPTGAGKTTQVPPALLDAGFGAKGRLLLLEPRRLAARAAARRIAAERGVRLGQEVGYHVRFDRQATRETKLLVVTPGILLRELQDDPYLESTSVVLFDEFHERGLEADLALGLLRLVQETVRPELKLVVMSATLDGAKAAAYLGGCPVLRSEGRQFPVAVRHRPRPETVPLAHAVEAAAREALRETRGDLLVFLPGVGEIRQCERRLEALAAAEGLALLPLYGDLPADRQDAVLRPSPQRKLVLATNVAETSVTIPGVTGVIDSGLARELRFDPAVGLDRLELVPISKASAEQRAGRAGRTQPGVCIRLWREADDASRPEHTAPEALRADLAGAVLQLVALGEAEPKRFPWLEAPPAEAVAHAQSLLELLGAVQAGRLTELGRRLAQLPVPPRLARLLLAGQDAGLAAPAALAAALLAERSPFLREGRPHRKPTPTTSDLLEQVEALESFEATGRLEHGCGALHRGGAENVLRVRDQLLRLASEPRRRAPHASEGSEEAFLRLLLAAYPDRVCRRREKGGRRALMLGGKGVRLAESSGVAEAELFLAIDVEAAEPEAFVRSASSIQRDWLPRAFLHAAIEVEFDEKTEKIVAWKRLRYQDLLLEENPAALPDGEATAARLAEAAAARLERVLPREGSAADALLNRVRWLAGALPELKLPTFPAERLRELVREAAQGCRSFAEIREDGWLAVLQGQLTPQQRQALAREAPERFALPSGRSAAVAYEPGRPPLVASRIQDFFGLKETPRFAQGRVKALLHLLAPNGRPQQVTDDLASFWKNTYATVRKELRGRYPKHRWPEDPLAADSGR